MFNKKKKEKNSNNSEVEVKQPTEENNQDPKKNKKSKKGLWWKILIVVTFGLIIVVVLCAVLIPKTSDVPVRELPMTSQLASSNLGNTSDEIVLETQDNTYVTIPTSAMQNASIEVIGASATKTTYLCYVSNSSLGKINFLFAVYENSQGPTGIQIGTEGPFISFKNPNQSSTSTSTSASSDSTTKTATSIIKSDDFIKSALATVENQQSSYSISDLIKYYQDEGNYNYANFLEYVYLNSAIWAFPSSSFDWGLFISTLFEIIFIIILIAFFASAFKGGGIAGGGDLFSMGKSQAKIAKTKVRFTDVGGIGEEKFELQEIVDFLKTPKKYASMGARIPKGVILYGPPGTGKTLLAKAVAGEANVPFLETNGSSFEDMLVGVGAKRVRDLFQKAKKNAPSIIFIDEIDSVAGKRSNNRIGDSGLANQTINELLSQMDGFNTDSGVIVIAATNRLDMLDEAILRPGRFDRQIPVNLPDIEERVQILKIHSRNKNISSKVSLEDVARRTPGFSGAQLENVLNEAALLAVRNQSNAITLGDIDEAIDRVVAGPAKRTRKISFEEKKQISFHEAGHALVGLNVKGSDVVEKITIIPRGKAAGYTVQTPSIQELQIQKKSDLLGLIASTLGGRASEEIIYGPDSISTGASNDLYKATNIAKSMVTQLGMTDLGMMQYIPSEGEVNPYRVEYSDKTAQDIDKKINEILKERYEFAKKILVENRRELELIVESLLILETIDQKQIYYIHKEKTLPPEVKAKIYFLIKTNQLDEAYLFDEEKKEFLNKDPTSSSDKNNTNNDNQDNDKNLEGK